MNDAEDRSLRNLLAGTFVDGTHVDIDARFERLELAELNDPTAEKPPTKAQRAGEMADSLTPAELRSTAERVLETEELSPAVRNGLQDILWSGDGPVIEERTRRDLAAAFQIADLVVDPTRFEVMLDRWWVLGSASAYDQYAEDMFGELLGQNSPRQLRRGLHQHVFKNPGDWSVEELFERLGAFEAVDRRFVGFVEDLVSHDTLPRAEQQKRVVDAANPVLRQAGVELREVDQVGGYPVFRIVPTHVPVTRPKTIIFGSVDKPDLRVSDTVENQIEVVDARGALIYDVPIGQEGLRGRDLRAWWNDHEDNPRPSEDPARSLYTRLSQSIPNSSPPQRLMFWVYHKLYAERLDDVPALLPEVWLHWDHRTVKERGVRALLGQRMDFLILGPNNQRIVLEVDGKTHYTDDSGRPSPTRYARNTQYDRDLQLRGYNVYRFGAAELPNEPEAMSLLEPFFDRLFSKHNLTIRT